MLAFSLFVLVFMIQKILHPLNVKYIWYHSVSITPIYANSQICFYSLLKFNWNVIFQIVVSDCLNICTEDNSSAPVELCSIRADSRLAPSQWETSLQSNAISHWLGANLESALSILIGRSSKTTDNYFCKMWFACETHRLNGSLVEQVLSVLVLSYVSAG